jgi:hypothetical protein
MKRNSELKDQAFAALGGEWVMGAVPAIGATPWARANAAIRSVARRMGKVVLLDGALVMKRVTLTIVLLLMGLCVFAQTENDFDITQNAKGTITITGYRGTAMDVTIPATIEGVSVTEIGAGAFSGKGITSVNIPNGIETIGEKAFFKTNMTSVTIPNSVTEIGKNAFDGGSKIGRFVSEKNGARTRNRFINERVIFGKIDKLVISNKLATIPDGAFANNQIVSIEIPLSVTSIEDNAFASNQLSSVVIPDNVKTIGENAFNDNQLTSVTIGENVTTIGSSAFANNKLTSIILPNSLITINGGRNANGTNGAFENNEITNVIIPKNVKSVGYSAFKNNKITHVSIVSGVTTFSALGSLFDDDSPFANNPIDSITVPANMDLRIMYFGDRSDNSHLFPNNFSVFYQSQNKKAGTYTWSGRLWSVK